MKQLTKNQAYRYAHAEAAQKSEGSIASYAKLHDLKPKNLYNWCSSYALKNKPVPSNPKINSFTRVAFAPSLISSSPALNVNINAVSLQFSSLPPASWLRELLSQSAPRS